MDVVNHTTKECGVISTGDECRSCVPAAGWETLTGSCPDGYTVLDGPAPAECNLYASAYCCQTVNSDWSGCAAYVTPSPAISEPAPTISDPPPAIPLWLILICLTVAGAVLYILFKRKHTGRKQ
ncbi:MAG TPA: hypothetical protein VFF78_06345, partial [Anaerolineaceae bacterium]|nr:hypothetical protein [Anaerolineaceae bacterium]